MKDFIKEYILHQIETKDDVLRKYTHHPDGSIRGHRDLFNPVSEHIQDFLNQRSKSRNGLIVYGLRGVGKTTLMAQAFVWLEEEHRAEQKDINLIFIYYDDVKVKLGVDLKDLLSAYQDFLGQPFEKLDKPTFIFLDEVQYDPEWAKTIKTWLDRTTKLFFFCTGSSAVKIQLAAEADLLRRIIRKRLYPLKFTEYLTLSGKRSKEADLSQELDEILYHSRNAQQVFNRLQKISAAVDRQWLSYSQADTENPTLFSSLTNFKAQHIDTYLSSGSMTFVLYDNPQAAHAYISDVVDKVIREDIQDIADIKTATVISIQRILFHIASSTGSFVSLDKLSNDLSISKPQLIHVLNLLIKAELLVKVPAHGSQLNATRKPASYNFMSPAIRAAYYNVVGDPTTRQTRKGQLLEDMVSMYYHQKFIDPQLGSLSYPYSSKGGLSDFVLQLINNYKIAIELSFTRDVSKKNQQLANTMKNINCKYGLVFAGTKLQINQSKSAVFVPLDYLFLT